MASLVLHLDASAKMILEAAAANPAFLHQSILALVKEQDSSITDEGSYTHEVRGDELILTPTTTLKSCVAEVMTTNPFWTSNSRILGRAAELYTCRAVKCPRCSADNWLECVTNEKSKDQVCQSCNKQFQIKCKKMTQKQIDRVHTTGKFSTIGAEYSTTLKSLEDNIDYILVIYNEQNVLLDLIHIKSEDITPECVVPRTPLAETARRAGWQGCTLKFDKLTSL